MKRYIRSTIDTGQCIDEVDGVKIYWDKDRGVSYIYTEPHGKGRMEFTDRTEAIEWIKENDSVSSSVKLSDQNKHVYLISFSSGAGDKVTAQCPEEALFIAAEKYLNEDQWDELLFDDGYATVMDETGNEVDIDPETFDYYMDNS